MDGCCRYFKVTKVVCFQAFKSSFDGTFWIDDCFGYFFPKIGRFFPNLQATLFGGQASWAKMTSAGGKLTAPPCHPTKLVNKAE
jgi:hypothetical protein